MPVLAGFVCGERRKRPDRKAEVEANTIEVAGADAGTGQDEQSVLRQKRPQFVHEREDRRMAAIHNGAAADLYDLHPREKPNRACAGHGPGEVVVEEGLARER
jgi:hypothetical protein